MRNITRVMVFTISVLMPLGAAATVFDAPVKGSEVLVDTLGSIAEQVRATIPVAGAFEQQKHLSIMTNPLTSSGTFSLSATGDFTWDVHQPYPVVYRQQEGMLTRDIDGATEQVSAVNEPALFGFFQFFSRVFDLDYQALAELFEVYLEADGSQWQLGLIPQDSRLKRAISQLTIEGEEGRIRRVNLMEPGGDFTRIHFSYTGQTLP